MVLAEECFYFTINVHNSNTFCTGNGGLCTFCFKMSIFLRFCGTF